MTDKILTTFHTSSAEKALLKQLAGGNVSAYLRGLVLADARGRGLSIPDDRLEDTRATHGGLNKSPDDPAT